MMYDIDIDMYKRGKECKSAVLNNVYKQCTGEDFNAETFNKDEFSILVSNSKRDRELIMYKNNIIGALVLTIDDKITYTFHPEIKTF